MRRSPRLVAALGAVLLSAARLLAQEVEIDVRRIGERILVLTEVSPFDNQVVAVAAEKGIVVVDATGSPYGARAIRERITREFGRDDFLYLVDTHHHWDHALGNGAFADAAVIGREGVPARLADQIARLPARIERTEETIRDERAALDTMPAGSEDAIATAERLRWNEGFLRGWTDGFVAAPAGITFRDRMTIDLGDATLELMYFGSAHSGTDIFVRVPEEHVVMTGDLLLDDGWLPLFCGLPRLDVDRWIETFDWALDESVAVRTVIDGHRTVYPREKLVYWREYVDRCWSGLKAADTEGLGFAAASARVPWDGRIEYLTGVTHDEDELERFHAENLRAFWRQLHESAAMIVERAIEEEGIEAALARYAELRTQDRAIVDENEFNALGYRLLASDRIDEAIEVFRVNAEAFPESWNVWDSLAEGYMTRGDDEIAVRLYRRSLELNPENRNGRDMLRRLGADEPAGAPAR